MRQARIIFSGATVFAMALATTPVSHGDDITWQGATTQSLYGHLDPGPFDVGSYTDPSVASFGGYDLWDTGNVPGAGDHAIFNFNTTQTDVWGNVVVNGGFTPDHITVQATGNSGYPLNGANARLEIAAPLTIETLTLNVGHGTTGGAGNVAVMPGQSLTLSGANPLSFTGAGGGWRSIALLSDTSADPAERSSLIFSGAAHTFDIFNMGGSHGWTGPNAPGPIGGAGGFVDFTGEEAVITLGDPGAAFERRSGGNANSHVALPAINVGEHTLRVRSDQTFVNPTGTGIIEVRPSTDGALPRVMVQSLDGDLPDMSNVAFRLDRSGFPATTQNFFIPGGSYQGIHMLSWVGHNHHRTHFQLQGDVNLAGGAVVLMDDGTGQEVATQSQYSIILEHFSRGGQRLILNGHTLTTERGVLVQGDTINGTRHTAILEAQGASVNIGGNLVVRSLRAFAGASSESRVTGILGDVDTIINLSGSYDTNVRSMSATEGGWNNNLHRSTMNLIGGDAITPNTFEVAADRDDLITTATHAIGTVHVGTPTESAYIQLVNQHLNDGMALDDDEVTRIKDGEVLLADFLNIHANSTLDLNGQSAKVVSELFIDPAGTLDLNTGLSLTAGDIIESFFGVGDQSATWAAFAGQVIDSSNPGWTFVPVMVVNSPETTYWQAVPEPASLALVGLGAVMLMGGRRRR